MRPPHRRRRVALVLAALVVAGGCGTATEDPAPSGSSVHATTRTPEPPPVPAPGPAGVCPSGVQGSGCLPWVAPEPGLRPFRDIHPFAFDEAGDLGMTWGALYACAAITDSVAATVLDSPGPFVRTVVNGFICTVRTRKDDTSLGGLGRVTLTVYFGESASFEKWSRPGDNSLETFHGCRMYARPVKENRSTVDALFVVDIPAARDGVVWVVQRTAWYYPDPDPSHPYYAGVPRDIDPDAGDNDARGRIAAAALISYART